MKLTRMDVTTLNFGPKEMQTLSDEISFFFFLLIRTFQKFFKRFLKFSCCYLFSLVCHQMHAVFKREVWSTSICGDWYWGETLTKRHTRADTSALLTLL